MPLQNKVLIGGLLVFVSLNIGIDLFSAQVQNSSFYLSESLLFSSYWLLFLPLLNILWRLMENNQKPLFGMVIIALATIFHLVCYPAIVWLLSKAFYYHTYSYNRTFEYGLRDYSIKTLIVYALSIPLMRMYKSGYLAKSVTPKEPEIQVPIQSSLTSILVSEPNNKKIVLKTSDVLYFSANSPYVNIHHPTKKYIHTETLKSLESKLNTNQFIRIHKSYILNICKVDSYKSRLNGDYDLMLIDGTVLRVSRNYAAIFKEKLENNHRLTLN